MRRHKLLKVKVCEFLTLFNLKKTSKLLVRDNLASVILILELVLTNVRINLTCYLSTSHLGTLRLSKESSKLIRDESGLYESGRSTVSGLSLALSTELGGGLKLTSYLTLESTEFCAKSRELGAYRLKLSHEFTKLAKYSAYGSSLLYDSRGCLYYRSRGRGRSRGLSFLSSLRSGGGSLSSHYTLIRHIYLSVFTQYIYYL
jgi:hypothetical protein